MTAALNFRYVNQALLRHMLAAPAEAAATCIVLRDTAVSLDRRVRRGSFHTKAEVHRTQVAAATALAAVRALRLKDADVLAAADVLVCFVRGEPCTASASKAVA